MSIKILTTFLSSFFINIPTLAVCLGACVVTLGKRKPGDRWSTWALCGFGLALLVAIASPVLQAFIQSWVMQSGSVAANAWIFTALSAFWALMHACIYILLFLAVLAGRE